MLKTEHHGQNDFNSDNLSDVQAKQEQSRKENELQLAAHFFALWAVNFARAKQSSQLATSFNLFEITPTNDDLSKGPTPEVRRFITLILQLATKPDNDIDLYTLLLDAMPSDDKIPATETKQNLAAEVIKNLVISLDDAIDFADNGFEINVTTLASNAKTWYEEDYTSYAQDYFQAVSMTSFLEVSSYQPPKSQPIAIPTPENRISDMDSIASGSIAKINSLLNENLASRVDGSFSVNKIKHRSLSVADLNELRKVNLGPTKKLERSYSAGDIHKLIKSSDLRWTNEFISKLRSDKRNNFKRNWHKADLQELTNLTVQLDHEKVTTTNQLLKLFNAICRAEVKINNRTGMRRQKNELLQFLDEKRQAILQELQKNQDPNYETFEFLSELTTYQITKDKSIYARWMPAILGGANRNRYQQIERLRQDAEISTFGENYQRHQCLSSNPQRLTSTMSAIKENVDNERRGKNSKLAMILDTSSDKLQSKYVEAVQIILNPQANTESSQYLKALAMVSEFDVTSASDLVKLFGLQNYNSVFDSVSVFLSTNKGLNWQAEAFTVDNLLQVLLFSPKPDIQAKMNASFKDFYSDHPESAAQRLRKLYVQRIVDQLERYLNLAGFGQANKFLASDFITKSLEWIKNPNLKQRLQDVINIKLNAYFKKVIEGSTPGSDNAAFNALIAYIFGDKEALNVWRITFRNKVYPTVNNEFIGICQKALANYIEINLQKATQALSNTRLELALSILEAVFQPLNEKLSQIKSFLVNSVCGKQNDGVYDLSNALVNLFTIMIKAQLKNGNYTKVAQLLKLRYAEQVTIKANTGGTITDSAHKAASEVIKNYFEEISKIINAAHVIEIKRRLIEALTSQGLKTIIVQIDEQHEIKVHEDFKNLNSRLSLEWRINYIGQTSIASRLDCLPSDLPLTDALAFELAHGNHPVYPQEFAVQFIHNIEHAIAKAKPHQAYRVAALQAFQARYNFYLAKKENPEKQSDIQETESFGFLEVSWPSYQDIYAVLAPLMQNSSKLIRAFFTRKEGSTQELTNYIEIAKMRMLNLAKLMHTKTNMLVLFEAITSDFKLEDITTQTAFKQLPQILQNKIDGYITYLITHVTEPAERITLLRRFLQRYTYEDSYIEDELVQELIQIENLLHTAYKSNNDEKQFKRYIAFLRHYQSLVESYPDTERTKPVKQSIFNFISVAQTAKQKLETIRAKKNGYEFIHTSLKSFPTKDELRFLAIYGFTKNELKLDKATRFTSMAFEILANMSGKGVNKVNNLQPMIAVWNKLAKGKAWEPVLVIISFLYCNSSQQVIAMHNNVLAIIRKVGATERAQIIREYRFLLNEAAELGLLPNEAPFNEVNAIAIGTNTRMSELFRASDAQAGNNFLSDELDNVIELDTKLDAFQACKTPQELYQFYKANKELVFYLPEQNLLILRDGLIAHLESMIHWDSRKAIDLTKVLLELPQGKILEILEFLAKVAKPKELPFQISQLTRLLQGHLTSLDKFITLDLTQEVNPQLERNNDFITSCKIAFKIVSVFADEEQKVKIEKQLIELFAKLVVCENKKDSNAYFSHFNAIQIIRASKHPQLNAMLDTILQFKQQDLVVLDQTNPNWKYIAEKLGLKGALDVLQIRSLLRYNYLEQQQWGNLQPDHEAIRGLFNITQTEENDESKAAVKAYKEFKINNNFLEQIGLAVKKQITVAQQSNSTGEGVFSLPQGKDLEKVFAKADKLHQQDLGAIVFSRLQAIASFSRQLQYPDDQQQLPKLGFLALNFKVAREFAILFQFLTKQGIEGAELIDISLNVDALLKQAHEIINKEFGLLCAWQMGNTINNKAFGKIKKRIEFAIAIIQTFGIETDKKFLSEKVVSLFKAHVLMADIPHVGEYMLSKRMDEVWDILSKAGFTPETMKTYRIQINYEEEAGNYLKRLGAILKTSMRAIVETELLPQLQDVTVDDVLAKLFAGKIDLSAWLVFIKDLIHEKGILSKINESMNIIEDTQIPKNLLNFARVWKFLLEMSATFHYLLEMTDSKSSIKTPTQHIMLQHFIFICRYIALCLQKNKLPNIDYIQGKLRKLITAKEAFAQEKAKKEAAISEKHAALEAVLSQSEEDKEIVLKNLNDLSEYLDAEVITSNSETLSRVQGKLSELFAIVATAKLPGANRQIMLEINSLLKLADKANLLKPVKFYKDATAKVFLSQEQAKKLALRLFSLFGKINFRSLNAEKYKDQFTQQLRQFAELMIRYVVDSEKALEDMMAKLQQLAYRDFATRGFASVTDIQQLTGRKPGEGQLVELYNNFSEVQSFFARATTSRNANKTNVSVETPEVAIPAFIYPGKSQLACFEEQLCIMEAKLFQYLALRLGDVKKGDNVIQANDRVIILSNIIDKMVKTNINSLDELNQAINAGTLTLTEKELFELGHMDQDVYAYLPNEIVDWEQCDLLKKGWRLTKQLGKEAFGKSGKEAWLAKVNSMLLIIAKARILFANAYDADSIEQHGLAVNGMQQVAEQLQQELTRSSDKNYVSLLQELKQNFRVVEMAELSVQCSSALHASSVPLPKVAEVVSDSKTAERNYNSNQF